MENGKIVCDKSLFGEMSFSLTSNQAPLAILQLFFIVSYFICTILFFNTITIFGIELPSSIFIYCATYMFLDSISELYGERRARSTVLISCFILLVSSIAVHLSSLLPSALSPEKQSVIIAVINTMPDSMFNVAVSLLVVDTMNVYIFHRIRKKTEGKGLWLRCFCSTSTSQTAFLVGLSIVGYRTNFYGSLEAHIYNTAVIIGASLLIGLCFIPGTMLIVYLNRKYSLYLHSKNKTVSKPE